MTPDSFLERLEHARPSGQDAWVARCPAHEDRHASLSIGLGRDGRLLLHCHTGCTPADIVDELGLTLADLFPDDNRAESSRPGFVRVPKVRDSRPPTPPRAKAQPPAVDEDDVARWDGRLQEHAQLLERTRQVKGWSPETLRSLEIGFDGRRLTFPVRAPGGDLLGVLRYLPGGEPKTLASRGAPRELWPAPELVSEGTLFVVEGEPDAVSAREIGLPAVALPGAAAWRDSWEGRLGLRTLVVIADCDAPGRAAAERVRARVGDVADVRIVDLDPDRDDGHDLGDEVLEASAWGELGLRALRRRILQLAGIDTVKELVGFGRLRSISDARPGSPARAQDVAVGGRFVRGSSSGPAGRTPSTWPAGTLPSSSGAA